MSWLISWLPALPSIDFAVPSSIQKRFVSFALQKCLGRILKPGQLDLHQLDSDIYSGYVQINNLELDDEAINSMLKNLPIKLHCGSISAVTTHIPWPNLLTSTIRLNIQSLHLTFHLIPHITETVDLSTANPAKSMTSMAKAFFRDKLASWEETALRESVHPDLASSVDDRMHSMPGSMDPFLHTTDNDEFHSDIDPAGVLIFASLIKRLLASCELDAVDTKITFTYPAHASFTLSLAEIRHRIEGASGDVSESGREEKITQTLEESRKILISGCTVSARDLRPSSPKLIEPSPPSPISSNSSPRFPVGSLSPHRSQSASATSSPPLLDEDPQISISQSLATLQLKLTPDAYLPPGSMTNTSPTYSEATDGSSDRRITPSLDDHICHPETNTFQSASRYENEDTARETDCEPEDAMILSYGTEPIVIELTTRSESTSTQHLAEDSSSVPWSASSYHRPHSPLESLKCSSAMNLKLSFSAGVLACAFRAWHIRSVLDMLEVCDSHHIPAVSVPRGKTSSASNFTDTLFALGLDASLKIRGVVILLLPSTILGRPCSLDGFFTNPLVPPELQHGCVRIFMDDLSTSCLLSNSTPTRTQAAGTAATSTTNVVKIDFTLGDLSAFALLAIQTSASHDMEFSTSPILITDQNLITQYPATHIHPGNKVREKHDYPRLSNFAILDWTAEAHRTNSTEVSTWRTKAQEGTINRQRISGVGVLPSSSGFASKFGTADGPETTHATSIVANAKLTWTSSEKGQVNGGELDDYFEIDVVPLHIFVDLGLALGDNALYFLDEVAGHRMNAGQGSHGETGSSPQGPQSDKFRLPKPWQRLKIAVNLSMIRLQIRCPPPAEQAPRSGAIILDLHDLNISNGTSSEKISAAGMISAVQKSPPQQPLFTAECERLVVATSLHGQEMASIVLSIGSLCSEDEFASDSDRCDGSTSPASTSVHPLPLQIHVSRSASTTRSTSSKTSVLCTIAVTMDSPSAHADLPKPLLEGLQLWANDVSKFDVSPLVGQTSSGVARDTNMKRDSRITSLVKSLFFAKFTHNGSGNYESSISGPHSKARIETVISITLSEAFVRLEHPRDNEMSPPGRCYDTFASDVDVLIEITPEGKDETLITLGVVDLNIYDTSRVEVPEPFVSFTAHRSFSTTPKSMVQLQFIPKTTSV